MLQDLFALNVSIIDQKVCQETTVENCEVYLDHENCITCQEEYFLTDEKQCLRNPDTAIDNCIEYNLPTNCTKCEQTYYLQNGNNCQKVTKISNCELYSQTDSSSRCTQCQQNYFSDGTNCRERQNNIIENCQTKHLTKDNCSKCTSSYVGNGNEEDGFLECFKEIRNCEEYSFFSDETTCTKCEEEYYLETNTQCTRGNLSNCIQYSLVVGDQQCLVCDNKFRLENTVCVEQETIASCDIYSQQFDNFCEKCEDLHQSSVILEQCTTNFNTILNCDVYNESNSPPDVTCEICEEGYFLQDSQTTCKNISILNCQEVESNNLTSCLRCEKDFGIVNIWNSNGNRTCMSPPDYISQNCSKLIESQNNLLANQLRCDQCSTNSYPKPMDLHAICIRKTRFATLSGNQEIEVNSEINSNCAVFGIDYNCFRCKNGYFLETEDHTCVQQCTGPIIPFQYNRVNHVINNECGDDEELEVAVEGVNLDIETKDQRSLIHISCKENHIAYISLDFSDTYYSNIDPLSTNYSEWIPDIMLKTPEVQCEPFNFDSDKIGDVNVNSFPQRCKSYIQTRRTNPKEYSCVKCQNGYTGSSNADGHLSCENTIQSCSSQKLYNIPLYWQKLSSCDSCSGTNEVPLLVYRNNSSSSAQFRNFQYFALDDDDSWSTGTIPENVQRCITYSKTEIANYLHIEDSSDVNLVDNCGFLQLQLTYTPASFKSTNYNTDSFSSSALNCGYCEPGYKPEFRGSSSNKLLMFVKSCTRIQLCKDNGNWVNACSECQYNYKYDLTEDKILYDECQPSTFYTENCLAFANGTNVSQKRCMVCNKGYTLNIDNKCEKLRVQSCNQDMFNYWETKLNILFENLETFYYLQEGIKGCSQCNDDNYVAVVLQDVFGLQSTICTETDYIQSNELRNSEDTYFVKNCAMYDGALFDTQTFQQKCKQCEPNYTLTLNRQECKNREEFPNCEIRKDQGNIGCHKCLENYALVLSNGVPNCVANKMSNCEIPEFEQLNSVQVCRKCRSGFFLNQLNNQCLEGGISNCDQYQKNQKYWCEICREGFTLIARQLLDQSQGVEDEEDFSRNYCFKTPSSMQCLEAEINISGNQPFGYLQFSCKTCEAKNRTPQPVGASEQRNFCLPFNNINDCDEYQIGTLLQDSNFSCKKCEDNFKREDQGYKCILREPEELIDFCQEYHSTKDTCEKCMDNYFLSSDDKRCLKFPDGIQGCLKYQQVDDEMNCLECEDNEYLLEDKKCTLILNPVPNCKIPKAEFQCDVCQENYFLQNTQNEEFLNSCEFTTISNCKTLISIESCETCKAGYFREEIVESGNFRCESVNDVQCDEFEADRCLKCASGYFPNPDDSRNKCKIVESSNIITDCIVYQNDTLCQECSNTTALSFDQLECKPKGSFDSDCLVQFENFEKTCSQCMPAYKLENGQCVGLQGDQSPENGCFKPLDESFETSEEEEEEDYKCEICLTGYFMDTFGVCKGGFEVTEIDWGMIWASCWVLSLLF